MKSIDDSRMLELQRGVDSLERRQAEQSAVVAGLRRDLEQAKEDDLNREALALSDSAKPPKPKAPDIQRALETAAHDLEVIGRALGMAQTKVGQYKAENAEKLLEELQRTKAKRARAVALKAKPLLEELRGFYAVDDDAKELKPYLQRPEARETGPPGSGEPQRHTLFLGGVQTTQTAFGNSRVAGLERGQLENLIGSLVRLSSAYPENDDQEEEHVAS